MITKIKFIKNPFEVTENDTIGSALIKGATEGYLKGMVAGGVGLGVLAIVGKVISKKENSKKKEKKHSEDTMKMVQEVMEENEFHKVEASK